MRERETKGDRDREKESFRIHYHSIIDEKD